MTTTVTHKSQLKDPTKVSILNATIICHFDFIEENEFSMEYISTLWIKRFLKLGIDLRKLNGFNKPCNFEYGKADKGYQYNFLDSINSVSHDDQTRFIDEFNYLLNNNGIETYRIGKQPTISK